MANTNVRIVVDQLKKFTAKSIRKLTLDVAANLIEDTPKDTSWAASNWIPTIGSPVLEVKPNPQDTSAVASAKAQQQSGLGTIATSYEINQGAIFLTNNVPYIIPLNMGSSQKAPAAFVQAGIIKGILMNKNIKP